MLPLLLGHIAAQRPLAPRPLDPGSNLEALQGGPPHQRLVPRRPRRQGKSGRGWVSTTFEHCYWACWMCSAALPYYNTRMDLKVPLGALGHADWEQVPWSTEQLLSSAKKRVKSLGSGVPPPSDLTPDQILLTVGLLIYPSIMQPSTRVEKVSVLVGGKPFDSFAESKVPRGYSNPHKR